MRLRIESDGNPRNTHVVHAETGERLRGVQAIKWSLDVHGHSKATIELADVELEAPAPANPRTGIRTWVRLKIDELRARIDPFDDWPDWGTR